MIKLTKSFWLSWMLATYISSVVGSALGAILAQFVTQLTDDRDAVLSVFAFLSMWGLSIGIGQWIILKTRMTEAWTWIPATAIGLSLGLLLGYGVIFILFESSLSNATEMLHIFLAATIAGVITGALQWTTLARWSKRALPWVSVSAISWSVGIIAVLFLINFMDDKGIDFKYLNLPLGFMLAGILPGIISGYFVESMLRQTKSENVNLPNTD
jgi:hypothetical protein